MCCQSMFLSKVLQNKLRQIYNNFVLFQGCMKTPGDFIQFSENCGQGYSNALCWAGAEQASVHGKCYVKSRVAEINSCLSE